MKAVQKKVDEGMDPADALRAALTEAGTSVSKLSRDHQLGREEISKVVNFRAVPTIEQLDALIASLGGTRSGWLEAWLEWAATTHRRIVRQAGAAPARATRPARASR